VNDSQLEHLVNQVRSSSKYERVNSLLVSRLCKEALVAGLSGKTAIKFVRNKLHQVGGAYFTRKADYRALIPSLEQCSTELFSAEIQGFSRQTMLHHASTAERLPIIETFYHTCLASISPIVSISDLACGLNPLALPWMPLADNFQYYACDIYEDMLELIAAFFDHCKVKGQVAPCDLIAKVPSKKTQVTFLLKSIPCLEQMDKSASKRLLENILSDHILVSFPVHSLSGRRKGMPSFYKNHFLSLISGKPWSVQEFHFQTEIAFLISK
jgi:16S rRNA (guanine(1405)-N(7))-methyltransferase